VAHRLVAREPDPPRHVTFGDLIEIYGPTLVYALVGLPIVLAAINAWRLHGDWLAIAEIDAVAFLLIALAMASLLIGIKRALENGVAAQGVILRATTMAGRVRVEVNGDTSEEDYRNARLQAGDHVTVLVDPRTKKLLLMIGR
jgi:hypothetical protein